MCFRLMWVNSMVTTVSQLTRQLNYTVFQVYCSVCSWGLCTTLLQHLAVSVKPRITMWLWILAICMSRHATMYVQGLAFYCWLLGCNCCGRFQCDNRWWMKSKAFRRSLILQLSTAVTSDISFKLRVPLVLVKTI